MPSDFARMSGTFLSSRAIFFPAETFLPVVSSTRCLDISREDLVVDSLARCFGDVVPESKSERRKTTVSRTRSQRKRSSCSLSDDGGCRRPPGAAPRTVRSPASANLPWQDLVVLRRDCSPLDFRVPTTELAPGIWSLQGNPDPDLDKTDVRASTTHKCCSAES
jgi:hypothetical protein